MSLVASIVERLSQPERRRTLRLVKPRVQLTLAVYLLLVTFGFGVLVAINTWYAYGRLYQGTLATAPAPFKQDITEQSVLYLNTSLVLGVGYVVAVLGVAVGYVHRMLGPIVAFERHLRALLRGDYTSRLSLRSSDYLYRQMADQLNDLANRLEGSTHSRR
jgi:hypothetical protein